MLELYQMIIDAHTHCGQFDDKYYAPEALIASMDEAGIDYSILLANDRTVRPGLTTEDAIKLSEKFPRLKPVGNIDGSKIDEEHITLLKDYLKQGKIFGVKLYAGYDNYYWWDARLDPLYEYCEKQGHTVAFHTGVLAIGDTGLLKQAHPLEADQVAAKFPNLNCALPFWQSLDNGLRNSCRQKPERIRRSFCLFR